MQGLLSVGQAAEQLEVSPSTVRNWVEKGYINAFRLPSGVRRIPQAEVSRLVNEYFSFAAPVEAEDEGSLSLRSLEEAGAQWGAPVDDVDPRGSSDRRRRGETPPEEPTGP